MTSTRTTEHPAGDGPAFSEGLGLVPEPTVTAGHVKHLADILVMRAGARDIPTGDLYRGITERQYHEARIALFAAIDELERAVAAERERPRQVIAYMATSRDGTVRFTDNPDAARELEGYGWAITPLADAHLIAAAPDLLAACVNARDLLATDRQAFIDCNRVQGSRTEDAVAHGLVWVDEDTWIEPEDAEPLRDYDRAIALIDAAMAKAAGGAA